jgi:hypothetical protein
MFVHVIEQLDRYATGVITAVCIPSAVAFFARRFSRDVQ